MDINISTPALLFPAITLLLLAYTNRFLAIAGLIRSLSKNGSGNKTIIDQIENLRLRMNLIRWMQIFGILSFVGSVLSIFFIYLKLHAYGNYCFAAGLLLLLLSLLLSFYETHISTQALEIELSHMEKECSPKG